MKTFVIACGGTGGHLTPGIALGEELTSRKNKCYLVVSQKAIDLKITTLYQSLEFVQSPGVGFSRSPWSFIKFCKEQIKAIIFSIKFLKKTKPDLVIGFGGFTTFGTTIAAFMLKYPRVLHEANHHPGKATRLLSCIAKRIYLPEGVSFNSIFPKPTRSYGFPIRKEIKKVDQSKARKQLNLSPNNKLLVVIGGSQGSKALTQWTLQNCTSLNKEGISIYCITGMLEDEDNMLVKQHKKTKDTVFVNFVKNISVLLNAADLVITRAGAGTIAELKHCCAPSVLIPYPHATDNHQYKNALFFEQRGGGILLSQDAMPYLEQEIKDLIFNKVFLAKIQTNLAQMKSNNSAKTIANDIESLLRQNKKATTI